MANDLERLKISKPGIVPVSRWNALVEAVQSSLVVSFAGGAFARTKGGTSLWARGRGAGATAQHPFQVLMRTKPGTEDQYQAGVVYGSALYKSLRPTDKVTISGLLSADGASGWFDLIATDAIWLGIVFNSSGVVTAARIDSWGAGDDFDVTQVAWSGENGYVEDDDDPDNPVHQTSRKLIAYTVPDEAGVPSLTQVMFRDQILRDVAIDGRPARYPFDHEGGYAA
ncbi:MAG: hypothetical protein FGM22_08310 [Burkholderiaceae bacterium]|nr:hypothetical protein [Burkholderiaceae bacterium]